MTGDILKLDVEGLIFGGKGFARTDNGQAVFISQVVPGETIYAKIVREHASYLEGIPVHIIKTSPDRVEPLCEHFSSCGGCDWQHIKYSEQVKWKEIIMKNHLRKALSEQDTEYYTPAISCKEYEYRSHIQLQCNSKSIGFYRKNTNEIIDIKDCPIAEKKIRDILPFLIKCIYNLILRSRIRAIELFALGNTVQIIIHSGQEVSKKALIEISGACKDLSISGAVIVNMASGSMKVIGDGCFVYGVETKMRRFSITGGLGGFVQANLCVNQMMVEHVVDLVKGSENVLDLFCGCGNFTVPVASVSRKVTGIDHDRRLTDFVSENAINNCLDNVQVITSDLGKSLDLKKLKKTRYDTVIMDPPRTGAAGSINFISRINPEKIVYVSCNTSTLARDMNLLEKSGYCLKSLRMFDMFPQTYHIETVACLEQQEK
ncbi:MAG TPA: 23S rRNA (uracil(1939)-C(5))-methyltransferase RlmD [Desulfomonilia bacterium]